MSDRFEKLPKWAQEEFERLRRERDEAVRTLRQFRDDQTPTPFSYTEAHCIGEGWRMEGGDGPTFITRYIDTHCVTVEHNNIRVDMRIRDDAVEIQATDKFRSVKDVAFIPKSYCQIEILSVEAIEKRWYRSDFVE